MGFRHRCVALLALLLLVYGCGKAPDDLLGDPLEVPLPQVETGPDVVWDIETDGLRIDLPESAVIPEGQDPSLAEDALAAAFALVRQQRDVAEVLGDSIPLTSVPPEKRFDIFRIALMLPHEGPAGRVGRDIQGGAELAMFKLAPGHVDMVFIDTSGSLDNAVAQARNSGADIVLGPLFSGTTAEVSRRLGFDGPPVISFSNDLSVAAPGVYLLGQAPEREIDVALSYALATTEPLRGSGRINPAVAILVDDSPYGARVAERAQRVLQQQGLAPAARVGFDRATLDDEQTLREAVRDIARRIPSSGGGPAAPPYDIVVLAGDVSFGLRVAPVLAWYDINPERVRFVGTSLWSSPAILQEPSLQRGIYADAPESRRRAFNSIWRETGARPPGGHATLGFDAVALSAALSAEDPGAFRQRLAGREGFAGFSGTFRFEPDGRNTRLLDVLEIDSGSARILVEAGATF